MKLPAVLRLSRREDSIPGSAKVRARAARAAKTRVVRSQQKQKKLNGTARSEPGKKGGRKRHEHNPPANVYNWDRSILSHPQVVVRPQRLKDLVTIITNPDQYPSPIRAVGSNYSTTRCAVADHGTLVDMTAMNRIIRVDESNVSVQAGALYGSVAAQLREHGLQLPVGLELGNTTLGSAACGSTRGMAIPGESGQLNAHACAMKIVSPTGNPVEITERRPDLLRVMRSSYGLLGIIYEVTFRVQPLSSACVIYETLSLDEFKDCFDALMARQASLKLYLHPFQNAVTLECRYFNDSRSTTRKMLWRARNWAWNSMAPAMGASAARLVPFKGLRYGLIDRFNQGLCRFQQHLLSGSHALPVDQIHNYPSTWNNRYTYSSWAFPERAYPRALQAYFQFARTYYARYGYRGNLQATGMRLRTDAGSLLSCSFNGPVVTLDAPATPGPEWDDFLVDFNVFCSASGGMPMFNQTKAVTRDQALKAYGKRLRSLASLRRRVDPGDRLINTFFMQLLD